MTFHDARRDPLPEDASFDLITAFDCMHDMTHPADVLRAVRKSLKPDGTWLHRRHQRQADLRREPRTQPDGGDDVRLLGVELHVVAPFPHPEGAGLGTLGFTEPVGPRR